MPAFAIGVLLGLIHLVLLGIDEPVLPIIAVVALIVGWRALRGDLGLAARPYIVAEVQPLTEQSVEIALRPLGHPLAVTPGQFLLVAFHDGPNYRSCGEFHPFTVSSIERGDVLRIAVKALGDCTRQMLTDAAGVAARIIGGFDSVFAHHGAAPQLLGGGRHRHHAVHRSAARRPGAGAEPRCSICIAGSRRRIFGRTQGLRRRRSAAVAATEIHRRCAARSQTVIAAGGPAIRRRMLSVRPARPDQSAAPRAARPRRRRPPDSLREIRVPDDAAPVSDLDRGVLAGRARLLDRQPVSADRAADRGRHACPIARFGAAELAQHATPQSCWMAINGAVYDITAYLPDHPSRPQIIEAWCGKEASDAYATKTRGRPHSREADQLLPKYRIGRFAP
ncbi:MAG: hypothetical protein MZV49_20135 [Rhodopseudomonas palustris]|nr:hypothetical protein [Rhodopseudomonas palustris]